MTIILLCLCFLFLNQKAYSLPENSIGEQIELHLSDNYAGDIEKGHRPNRMPSNIKVSAYFNTKTKVLTIITNSGYPIQVFCQITEKGSNALLSNSALVSRDLLMTITAPLMANGCYHLIVKVGHAVYCGVINI